MFKFKKKEKINHINKLYEQNASLMESINTLMKIVGEQQKEINKLQKQQNNILHLISNKIEES